MQKRFGIGASAKALVAALLIAGSAFGFRAYGATSALPAGKGKEMVEGVCTTCHQTNQITRSSGYTRAGWKELANTMIDLSATPGAEGEIADYLAAHFPPNDKRAPKLVPGDTAVTFTEWVTPTLGQRSRDPIQAPDGTIWWAGQWAT